MTPSRPLTVRRPGPTPLPRQRAGNWPVLVCAALAVGFAFLSCAAKDPRRDADYESEVRAELDRRHNFLHNEFQTTRQEILRLIELLRDERSVRQFREELVAETKANQDVVYRANMVYVMASAGYPEVEPLVLAGMDAETPYVRKEAVRAFAVLNKREGFDRIEPLLGSKEPEPIVRQAAQDVYLTFLEQADYWRILQILDAEEDPILAEYWARCLTELYDNTQGERLAEYLAILGPKADRLILSTLAGRFRRAAFAQLRAIYLGGTDTARPDDVRGAALVEIAPLIETSDDELRETMLDDLLAARFDVDVLGNGLIALGLEGEHISALVTAALDMPVGEAERCPPQGVWAVRLVAQFSDRDPDASALLQEAFLNPDLREIALDALPRVAPVGDPGLVDALAAGLDDERASIVQHVIDALVEVGDAHAIDMLVTALSRDRATTVESAAKALVELKVDDLAVRENIWRVLSDGSAKVFNLVWALHVLGEVGDELDIEYIETNTQMTENPRVAESIRNAIARIRARQ